VRAVFKVPYINSVPEGTDRVSKISTPIGEG
jgi:hypothetical protein